MAFSSVHEMIDLCKESGKPLYEVILESDLAESGLTRAESEAEMHRLWAVMQATSDGYCGADRSMSGFAGGDAAKVNAAAARGVLYADGYFADVMAEALKTAECNACMKRIVAAPTAGSCGVLPAVLLPYGGAGWQMRTPYITLCMWPLGSGRLWPRGPRWRSCEGLLPNDCGAGLFLQAAGRHRPAQG